jgi:osmotically-inducible protein OsmY
MPGETMKLNSALRLTILCAALGGGLLVTGCSSTPTRESAGEVVDDAWITTKVKSSFVEDPAVSALNIQVETFKGVVQLSGFANNSTEMTRAAEIARGIKGVKSVKNDIRLKSTTG